MKTRAHIASGKELRDEIQRLTRRDFLKVGGAGVAGAAFLGTAGCGVFSGGGQGSGNGGGGGGGTINYNLEDTVRDLDSAKTTDSVSTEILLNVMSGLHRLDENTQPVPDLAESYDLSDDGLVYTFKLRDGIKWSNGDPVTSHDFKYAWLRALNPDTASQYAYIISSFVKGADAYNTGDGKPEDVAVETPDDKTLKVTLIAPAPYWLGLTSFFTYLPQNQKYVESKGEKYALSADALIYNGPYILTQFNPTSGCTVVKNKDYWNADNVSIPKLEGRIVKEVDTAVNLFESSELQETYIDSEYVDEYEGKSELVQLTQFATGYIVPQYELPIFKNINIRKALQIGFDRAAMNNKILNDGSVPATGYVPAGIAGPGDQTFREAEGQTMPDYDPAKAKELWKKGTEEFGDNPTIELLTYDDSTSRDLATFFQSEMKKMGAKIEIKVQPFSRKLQLETEGKFELSNQAWIADYNDPMTFMELFESTNTFNTYNYKNERYDQLIGGAREESDKAKRMEMLLEAEKILVAEDAGVAPWRFYGASYLIQGFTNFVNQPYGGGKDYSLWKLD